MHDHVERTREVLSWREVCVCRRREIRYSRPLRIKNVYKSDKNKKVQHFFLNCHRSPEKRISVTKLITDATMFDNVGRSLLRYICHCLLLAGIIYTQHLRIPVNWWLSRTKRCFYAILVCFACIRLSHRPLLSVRVSWPRSISERLRTSMRMKTHLPWPATSWLPTRERRSSRMERLDDLWNWNINWMSSSN